MTTMTRVLARIVMIGLVVAVAHSGAFAQGTGQTGTQFYMAYRAAFDKATKIDDLKPYQSKAVLAQIASTPAAQRGQMFEMIKMMGTLTNVKVLKETATKTGATLSVEGINSDKAKTTGEITLVKEDGAWKLDKESWKS